MAGHICVSAIVRGYIQEDQAFSSDGNSAIRINMQSAIPGMCTHVRVEIRFIWQVSGTSVRLPCGMISDWVRFPFFFFI